jgi:hypothetical protein
MVQRDNRLAMQTYGSLHFSWFDVIEVPFASRSWPCLYSNKWGQGRPSPCGGLTIVRVRVHLLILRLQLASMVQSDHWVVLHFSGMTQPRTVGSVRLEWTPSRRPSEQTLEENIFVFFICFFIDLQMHFKLLGYLKPWSCKCCKYYS